MRSFIARRVPLAYIYDKNKPGAKKCIARYEDALELTCRHCAEDPVIEGEEGPCTFLSAAQPKPRAVVTCPYCGFPSRVPDRSRWS